MRRSLVILLLVFSLGLPPGMADAQSQRRTTKRKAKNAKQLRSDLARLRAEKNRLRRELRTTKRQATEVMADIRRVDSRLVEVENDLSDTTYRLGRSRDEQEKVTEELKIASENLARVREQVRTRLRDIYMRGPSSSISVFIGTKSARDLASRTYLLQAIAKKDRQIFDDYTRLQGIVADRKRRTDELVQEISSLAQRQRSRQSELKDVRREKGQYLGELKEKQGKLEDLLRQFEADERQIQAQIQAFSRRRRRGGQPLPRFIGRFMKPVSAPLTSHYGYRFHPILRVRRLHAGVDFGARTGTPIRAAAGGEVIAAQYMRGYGNTVIIDHGGGISTVYAHCSRLNVGAGQMVKQGQVIGAVGSTGLSTGPHLHWEVRVNGRPVNPLGRF